MVKKSEFGGYDSKGNWIVAWITNPKLPNQKFRYISDVKKALRKRG